MQAPDAFRQQLLVVMPRLRRYARSLVFDMTQADDLVQTALERALSHWHQFDQRRDMLVWVLSIAHNAYLDQRRRDARMTGLDIESDMAELQSPDPTSGIGLRLDLEAALASLPPQQREPLLLVGVEQLSYAECAEILQVPIGTVMSRIARGRAALREHLDGGTGRPPAGQPVLRRVV
ncbi:MAG: RNA polymerase sigma factor [Aquabacterium sp.]